MGVTFITVAVILAVVFTVLLVDARDRVRAAETDKLPERESAATTPQDSAAKGDAAYKEDHALQETVTREVQRLASTIGANVVAALDPDGRVFASGVTILPSGAFRYSSAPLLHGDRSVGTLVVATSLDHAYAEDLSCLADAGIVVTVNDVAVAGTVGDTLTRAVVASASELRETMALGGEEYAIRTLMALGAVRIYMLTSIDAVARGATRSALLALGTIALWAFVLAAFARLWLARTLTDPIHRVSHAIATMTAARDFSRTVEPMGKSRELDARTAAGGVATTVCLAALVCASPAFAQRLSTPSWLTLDTSADVDRAVDDKGVATNGAIFDAYIAARLAPGLEIAARPWTQRQANGEWNRQLWLAAVRFEHKGPVGVRVEGGLITSPVGLANLSLRPHLNPTIAQPSSLFQGLPPPEPLSPRVTLLGAVYPLGVSTTVSGTHWDARGAIIDTSPLRARRTFGTTNPYRFANVVMGGGITPAVGLRIGGSVTYGGWRREDEVPFSTSDRMATIVTVEGEWSFRYTKLLGEWTRDRLETNAGHAIEQGWYLQGQQTLTPRWFVAGRVERLEGPPLLTAPLGARQSFMGAEETLGFRVTTEVTVRGSYRARRLFSQESYQHQVMASVVWARRWF